MLWYKFEITCHSTQRMLYNTTLRWIFKEELEPKERNKTIKSKWANHGNTYSKFHLVKLPDGIFFFQLSKNLNTNARRQPNIWPQYPSVKIWVLVVLPVILDPVSHFVSSKKVPIQVHNRRTISSRRSPMLYHLRTANGKDNYIPTSKGCNFKLSTLSQMLLDRNHTYQI